jgi:hypothetical protein
MGLPPRVAPPAWTIAGYLHLSCADISPGGQTLCQGYARGVLPWAFRLFGTPPLSSGWPAMTSGQDIWFVAGLRMVFPTPETDRPAAGDKLSQEQANCH